MGNYPPHGINKNRDRIVQKGNSSCVGKLSLLQQTFKVFTSMKIHWCMLILLGIYSCTNNHPKGRDTSEDTVKKKSDLFVVDTIEVVNPVVVTLKYQDAEAQHFQSILISKINLDPLHTINYQSLVKSGGILFVMPHSFNCLLANLLYDSSSTAFTSEYLNLQAQYRDAVKDTIWRISQKDKKNIDFDKGWVVNEILPTKFLVGKVSNNALKKCQSMEQKVIEGDIILKIAVPLPKKRM